MLGIWDLKDSVNGLKNFFLEVSYECSAFSEEKERTHADRVGKSRFSENAALTKAFLTKGSCLNT